MLVVDSAGQVSSDITRLIVGMSKDQKNVRLEALVGLAERRDPGVLMMIRDELGAETVDRLVVDAARAFADRSLVASLRDLRGRWDEDPALLERAIRACEAGAQET